MIDTLRTLIPEFSHFQDTNLSDGHESVGHQVTMVLKDNTPFAGGTHADLNSARRICAAEAIERAYYLKSQRESNEHHDPLLLRLHPTTCGFAAGFERQATAYRAVCEAVERWCWSKWVDVGLKIERAENPSLSNLTKHLARDFESVIYLQKTITLSSGPLLLPFIPREFQFSVAIGISNGGIFPGSRVTTAEDNCWEHPVLEAWRHLHIFRNELRADQKMDIFDRRIFNFGSVGAVKLHHILEPKNDGSWPMPALRLNKEIPTSGNFFVWRALCDDYVGWELGDESRFVY